MENTYRAKIRLINETGSCISESKDRPSGEYWTEITITDTMLENGDKIEIVKLKKNLKYIKQK
jgi:hypothetical protein